MTQVQPAAGGSVQVAFADQGYTGAQPSQEAAQQGVNLELVKLSGPRKASCCCPSAGRCNAPSACRRALAVSAEIMNVCPTDSPA
jgi:hypothetical protein